MNVIFIASMIGVFLISICAPRENEKLDVHSVWKTEHLQSDLSKEKSSPQNTQNNDFNT
ncbi:hypothetical protein ACFPT0_12150 [Acinetobacter portensis]|uniref:hypothetical protein n=1 Tax=Acinetobacter portensis TaxID=1839785 RepID=UPI00148F04EF|nr:hypothetical protein [Acinetobacter portensis]